MENKYVNMLSLYKNRSKYRRKVYFIPKYIETK